MTSLRRHSILLLCCLLIWQPATAADLRLAVASNFARTAEQLGALFTEQTGHQVHLSAGSTGKLYAQIVNGAPFDVLLAADTRRPELLEISGKAATGSRFTYARGMLVAWSRDSELISAADGLPDFTDLRRIAIANPQLAPYGQAAQETLQELGLWETAEPKLVRGESIGQAYQFVASGNAQLGFIARSQLQPDSGSHWPVPAELHQPVDQQLVRLSDTEASRAFVEFMRSPAAQSVILAAGYLIPGTELARHQ